MKKRKDPKKGTGKKPKGSGRRLYTDEKPSYAAKMKNTMNIVRKRLGKKKDE